MTRANTYHAIYIFRIFHYESMSIDIDTLVRRIIKDECDGCEHECELCQEGPCNDLVRHVGLFFINWAIDEFMAKQIIEKKKEKQ